jgi:hypothetical protein
MEDQSNDQGANDPFLKLGEEEDPPEDRWPQQPPKYRRVYGFTDPVYHVTMVALTAQTWMDITNNVNRMKKQLDELQVENIKMKQGLHVDGPRIVLPS